MFNLDLNFIVAFFFGVLVLYILARILLFPLKVVLRFILNAVVGGGLLALFNILGGFWGLHIGINVVTAFIVGFTGVPGIVLLLIMQRLTS